MSLELIAVIAAAIAAYEGTQPDSFRIKKISGPAKKTSVWSRAGRADCMRSRQLY